MKRRSFLKLVGTGAAACLSAPMLAGCGSSGSHNFTWFVDTLANNLDPQVAADSADMIACTHLFSGLLRRQPDGGIAPDAAESYTVTPDGCTYTFSLKQNRYYRASKGVETEYPVTADDFVFALQRTLSPVTASPFAECFLSIENAPAVLAGKLPPEELGVSAADPYTLTIRLSRADEAFLENLCLCGAFPCNRSFFEQSRGAYGLKPSLVIGNGPFYLANWTSSGMFLRRASSGTQVDYLRLIENTAPEKSDAAQIIEGRCTAILSQDTNMLVSSAPYHTRTTALLFQCGGVFGNTFLRQAFTAALQEQQLVPAAADPPEGLIPPDVRSGIALYRQQVGTVAADPGDLIKRFQQALAGVKTTDLQGLSILLCEGQNTADLADRINEIWQRQFSCFCTVRTAPAAEFAATLASQKFSIAIADLQATEDTPLELLSRFENGAILGWSNAGYAQGLNECRSLSGRELAAAAGRAEQLLLDSCALVPLYHPRDYLLTDSRVTGLTYSPFGPALDVTNASLG